MMDLTRQVRRSSPAQFCHQDLNAHSTNSTPGGEDELRYTQQYHIRMHRSQLIIENIMNAHSKNKIPCVEDGIVHSALQQHYCNRTHLLTLTNTYRHKKGQLHSHEWCKVEDHQESAGSLAGRDSTWAGSGWQHHLHHTKDHKVCSQLSWQPHRHCNPFCI